jgi:hypothetical protein
VPLTVGAGWAAGPLSPDALAAKDTLKVAVKVALKKAVMAPENGARWQ